MRATTETELALLHSFNRNEGYSVEVKRSGEAATDISDRALSVTVDFAADEEVSTCSVDFDDTWTVYGSSSALSPLVSGSSYNSPSPLLWPENEIYVYAGVAAEGEAVSSYKLLFHGVLGDEIQPSGRKDKRTISVTCRDLAKRLQDRQIVGEWIYGSDEGTSVVAVIQGVLDQAMGDDAITLHVEDNPNFMVYPVKLGDSSVWDAIQDLIKPTGYQVRYWYFPSGATSTDCEGNTINVTSEDFYLSVIDPDRDKAVSDDSLSESTDTIVEESLGISDDTIRNSVTIKYYDRDTKQYMEVHRDDMDSIATYGLRDIVVGQDDVPFIDTYGEAWDLAGVILNDLSEVPSSDKFDTQLMYHIEPFDLLDVTAARLVTGTTTMGVRRVSFTMSADDRFRVAITGVRERIIGQVGGWLTSRPGAVPAYKVENLTSGTGRSTTTVLRDGTLRVETILEVVPPPAHQVESYEWRWAVSGEGIWHEQNTRDPVLRIYGLPHGTTVAWTCRARLVGQER
jgi:hypothetical protein